MDKRWTLIIVTILMMLLIYSFLSMVLKKDRKRTAHTRMYRDYSSYNQKKSLSDYSNNNSDKSNYSSSNKNAELRNNLINTIMNNSVSGYNTFMKKLAKNDKSKPKEIKNPQYVQMIELSRKPLPELQIACNLFRNGDYEEAITKLEEALEKLDPLEIKNRIQIYSFLSECYLKLKDDENYIESKIKQVRIQRGFLIKPV